jgi:hypothetical protein
LSAASVTARIAAFPLHQIARLETGVAVMLTQSVKEMLDSLVEFKKAAAQFYAGAMKLENLHPIAKAAFEAVAPKNAAVSERVSGLRALPALSSPDGGKSVTIEFVLNPNRNRILPPDSELNVYLRALEHHKRSHQFISQFAAVCGIEPLKKELESLAATELSLRNDLQHRFDEWDANTYGTGQVNA